MLLYMYIDLIHNGSHHGKELGREHQKEASEASRGRTFRACDTKSVSARFSLGGLTIASLWCSRVSSSPRWPPLWKKVYNLKAKLVCLCRKFKELITDASCCNRFIHAEKHDKFNNMLHILSNSYIYITRRPEYNRFGVRSL